MAHAGSWRGWLSLAAALVGLNLALSFNNLWPTPWVTVGPELSVEIAGLVLVLSLAIAFGRRPSPGWLHGLALLLLLWVLGRYLAVTAPALYGRPINLYWDSRHLPAVAAMLLESRPGWQVALIVAGAAAGLAALYVALRGLLGLLVSALAVPAPRRVAATLAVGLVVLFAAGRMHPDIQSLRWFAVPVTATYVQQLRFVHAATTMDAAGPAGPGTLPDAGLTELRGADVMLVFLESYGATTLDHPGHAAALADARTRLADRMQANGFRAVSARVRSPTFGGGSWRAHASLLSGIEIDTDRDYALLLTQDRDTLVHRFAANGYRTVALMPGLRKAWPEGEFYGYDRVYDAASLDYPGPAFGWWVIPDQFALATLHAREIALDERAPILTVAATITSHAPFRPVPPYLADWQVLAGHSPYADPPDDASGGRMDDDYVAAMDYALTTVAGYIDWASRHRGRDLVLLLVGDHQPPARVTGPDAAWDVPIHLVTRDPALAGAMLERGFVAGLVPAAEPVGAMHELTASLLGAWSGSRDGAVSISSTPPPEAPSGIIDTPGIDIAGRIAGIEPVQEIPHRAGIAPGREIESVALADGAVVAVSAQRLEPVDTGDRPVTRGR